MRIEGVVRLADLPPAPLDVTVRVRLLDTTLADGLSEVLAEAAVPSVPLGGDDGSAGIRFALDTPDLSPERSYILAAHVDVSGNGEIAVGDYITMEAVPVPLDSARAQLEVPVRRVAS